MALPIVISRNAPSTRVLWLRPAEDTVYVHTTKGWVPLQNAYLETLAGGVEAVADALEGKQDALTPGENITIRDNVISATDTDTKPYTVMEALPKMPKTDDAEKLFLIPYDGGYEPYVWQDGAWAHVGDTHEEFTAAEVDAMWDGTE